MDSEYRWEPRLEPSRESRGQQEPRRGQQEPRPEQRQEWVQPVRLLASVRARVQEPRQEPGLVQPQELGRVQQRESVPEEQPVQCH